MGWKAGDNDDNCLTGTVSGSGNAATWESAGIVMNNVENFDYRRRYQLLRNFKTQRCCRTNSATDTTVTKVECEAMDDSWMFEIIYDVSYVVFGIALGMVVFVILNVYYCYKMRKNYNTKHEINSVSFEDEEERELI